MPKAMARSPRCGFAPATWWSRARSCCSLQRAGDAARPPPAPPGVRRARPSGDRRCRRRDPRPTCASCAARDAFTLDASRPEAVAKRHALGLRTARENIADLCDAGSFVEYGALAFAAQQSRRSLDDLIRNTPADGMVTGIGSVNAALFGAERSRAVVMAYDATVLAGTQGMRNHQKTDRMLGIALEQKLPVVLFAEGGGGRPGDVDMPIVAGLHVATFASFARLSRPGAGARHRRRPLLRRQRRAARLLRHDHRHALELDRHGRAGDGRGRRPRSRSARGDRARARCSRAHGVIDVLVEDEAEAVAVARRYLSIFQGRVAQWQERRRRRAARPAAGEPAARLRRSARSSQAIVDPGSTLELRAGFGAGVVTALARIEGRPVGMLASNPAHLGGAIDADAADKAARFMQLCDAHGLPIVSLVDTPGFMVGPEIETRGQVRHVSRMFVVAAQLRVPVVAVVLRKALRAGGDGDGRRAACTRRWRPRPGRAASSGRWGWRARSSSAFARSSTPRPPAPSATPCASAWSSAQYAKGKALNMAATLEIDAVIDPAETRRWLAAMLASRQRPATPAVDSSTRGESRGSGAAARWSGPAINDAIR